LVNIAQNGENSVFLTSGFKPASPKDVGSRGANYLRTVDNPECERM